MSRLFRDTMSNDPEGAEEFESNVAESDALDDIDGPDDDDDEEEDDDPNEGFVSPPGCRYG